eukprot:CAMPEP_0183368900 /NCGR_PEP_ID=MMETSP0164_2-20130417/97520_1 /TAXON_ID=221442 /ORGANISM="Coccolithus pelagicus ssp braarudi, Strain PLY182g" /LENGTH=83 /DNA_ID=CAMNT_0025545073 /DNA_START=435 /DNA_END=686 /DNA_ORIENTATION=+
MMRKYGTAVGLSTREPMGAPKTTMNASALQQSSALCDTSPSSPRVAAMMTDMAAITTTEEAVKASSPTRRWGSCMFQMKIPNM